MPISWPPTTTRRPWHALRRRLARHRRLLAAACLAVAVYAALLSQAPPPPHTVAVWTAARQLPAGQTITAGDLRRVDFAATSAPPSRLSGADEAVGRVLAQPLEPGDPVARADLVGREWLRGRPGVSAVPIRLSDPAVAALLRPGDRVDLVGASALDSAGSGPGSGEPAAVIARDLEVISLPRSASSGGFSSQDSGRLVVFAAPETFAPEIARVAATNFVTVIWTR